MLKSDWDYREATNIVSHRARPQATPTKVLPELVGVRAFFEGRLLADPAMALDIVRSTRSVATTT